jgi:hypothetical protein
MNAHTNPTMSLEDELSRNVALLRSHGQAIDRLKFLEGELAALNAAEQHEAEKYAMGFQNDAPIPRDEARAELAKQLAGARVAARSAELSIPALTAVQNEIRQRLEASKTIQTKSLVEKMLDEDLADSEQVDALADGIRDLLHRRKAVRLFLSEQGRALVARGDHANGVQVLQMVERSGPVSVPVFDLDQRKVAKAAADHAASFARRKAGG